MNRPAPSRANMKRPVLYQLCRAGERFEVGDGPVPLGNNALVMGRGDPARTDAQGVMLVDDPWMSTKHAQVTSIERRGNDGAAARMTGKDGESVPGRYFIEDLGSTNGVMVNGVLAQRAPLLHGDLVETGRTFWVYVEESATDPLLEAPFELGPIVTWTPSLAAQLSELHANARTEKHALITGPEGSGKGFLARTLHTTSGRAGRFIHLDCRERKQKRLVVDLFGTDGNAGRVREAEGGTLFLENLDALALELQDKLVDALKRRPMARVFAAMSQTRDEATSKNHLRPALADLLSGLSVQMPGLNQRRPDFGLLLDDFLARARGAPAISRDAARAMIRFSFRLHVKALARVVEAAATLSATTEGGMRAGTIETVHLPVDVLGPDVTRALLNAPVDGAGERTGELPRHSETGPEASMRLDAVSKTGQQVRPEDFGRTDPEVGQPSSKQSRAVAAAASQLRVTDPPKRRREDLLAAASSEPSERMTVAGDEKDPEERTGGGFETTPVDVEALTAALRAAHGNVTAAARQLGQPRALVQRWLREFAIDPTEYR